MSGKKCTVCGEVKPASEFSSRSDRAALRSHCKECRCRDAAARYADGGQARRYSLTPEEYALMLAKQHGRCALCFRDFGTRTPHVDHDHACCPGRTSCGRCVRALLCGSCNLALGVLKLEWPGRLERVQAYLAGDLTYED